MTNSISDPRDQKKLPDPLEGVENNEKVTNTEDQQLIDDVVADTSEGLPAQEEEQQTISDKDKKDISDIN